MTDQWADQLTEATYGGLRLDVRSTQDDISRALARYQYPYRDGADLEDMGGEPWTTRCQIIFFPREGQDARRAFLDFLDVVRRGQSQVFNHPIFGERRCKVGQLSAAAEFGMRDAIMVEAEFIEDTVDAARLAPGAGAPVGASVEEIAAISADIDAGLVDVNDGLETPLATTVGSEAVAQVGTWETDETLTERDVRLAAASLANKITSETNRLELATHIDRWPLVVAFARLHYAVRRAAEAFVQRSPRLFEITVDAPAPLLVIAARTYGADQASARYEQLLQLNDVRTPNRVPRGTVIKAPLDDSRRRSSRRA